MILPSIDSNFRAGLFLGEIEIELSSGDGWRVRRGMWKEGQHVLGDCYRVGYDLSRD